MIEVHWATEDRPASDEAVRAAAATAARHGGRDGLALSVVFVSEADLTALHAEHLQDPSPTDVITFDLTGGEGEGPAGELYVSVERARAVAAERGQPVERELLLYVVHGVLHLCGLDDHAPDERARMRSFERAVLAELGQPDDDAPHDDAPHDDAPHEDDAPQEA